MTRANPNIVVATPCYGGLVTQRYMQGLIGLMQYGPLHGFDVRVELIGYDSLVTRARNTLVARFLDHADASHLLFVDADIGFEPRQVERMLRFDEDIVAGMYPLKLIEWNAAVLERLNRGEAIETATLRYVGAPCVGEEAERREGFITGDYAGAGFLLIKREALLALAARFPESAYVAAHNFTTPVPSQNLYALFDCMIDPVTREYLSEDYAFCAKWRSTGGKIWLDTESALVHTGPRDFAGDARTRFA